MQVEVFDDVFSLGHLILGILSYFHEGFFVLFVFYELVEFCYKSSRKRETPANFIGDLCEFFIGLSFMTLFTGCF